MSHIARIELEIRDLEALRAACRNLGLELSEQDTFRWYQGRSACNYAIRIPGADESTYEIGLKTRQDGRPGYELLWDNFDRRISNAVGHDAGLLKQNYTAEVARRHYQRKGYRVTSHMKDKRMILEAVK